MRRRTRTLSHCLWTSLVLTACFTAGCSKNVAIEKQAALAAGNTYFDHHDYANAVVEYQRALQLDPRFPEAEYKLAQSYDQLGDGANAARAYIRAADLLPNDPDAQVRAGLFLLVGGKFEDAKSQAMKALAIDPRHVEAQLLLGEALLGMQDPNAAVQEVENGIRMDPDPSDEARGYGELGRLRAAQGSTQQAETAFLRAVSLDPSSVHATVQLAKFYLATGRFKDADSWLKKAVGLAPNDIEANRTLAALDIASGHLPEAEKPLQTVARASSSPLPQLVLADYYFATKRREDARRLLDALAGNPTVFADVRLRLSVYEAAAGHQDAAYRDVNEIIAKDPNNPQAAVLKGRYLMNETKYDQAKVLFQAAVTDDPQMASAHYWLGMADRAERDSDGARAEFNQVQRLAPFDVSSKLQLTQLDLLDGQADAAASLVTSALSLQPHSLAVRLTYVDVLIAQNKLQDARNEATAISKEGPTLPQPAMQLGRIAMKAADYATAEREFSRAMDLSHGATDAFGALVGAKIAEGHASEAQALVAAQMAKDPKSTWLHIYAARADVAAHDPAKAETELKQVVAADPSNLEAYLELTRIYAAANNLDATRTQLEAIVARQPNAVWAQTLIAMTFHLQNRIDEAKARYEKILTIDPQAAIAANNLAMIYVDEGQNLDRALTLAQTAKRQLPASPEVNDTLGLVFTKKGLANLAIPDFQTSIQASPSDPVFRYHLGLAYAQGGDRTKARACLEQALAMNASFDGAADARRVLAGLSSSGKN